MLICAWLKSWYLVPSIHPWAGCYSREKETIWAAFLPFIVWNPWRLRERQRAQSDGEVERWGTEGPVRTRRHCVAPQLCWTDSLHYSTLQQPAPQSTANLLLTAPLASSGKGGGDRFHAFSPKPNKFLPPKPRLCLLLFQHNLITIIKKETKMCVKYRLDFLQ